MSEFNYSKILLIGATSGIGHALAEKILLSRPSAKLIVVGRRQERLDEFVQKWGEERVEGVAFDVTDLGGIEGFARK
jgi:NADP-dependent 3-hydroxy acid dehydrogenase YdfG